MEFQKFIHRNKIEIASVFLASLALFGVEVLIDQHINSPTQTADTFIPPVQDTHNNSVIVQEGYKTYIESCDNYSLVKDPFGPRTADSNNVKITTGDPACADNWLSAKDFPLTK